jgi:hypothetical protein
LSRRTNGRIVLDKEETDVAPRPFRVMQLLTFVGSVAAAICAALVVSQANGNVVRCERFELVDSNGKVRAQIKVEPEGDVVFRLRDQKGDIRVKLAANEKGAGLILMDRNADPGIQARSSKDAPELILGKQRLGQ